MQLVGLHYRSRGHLILKARSLCETLYQFENLNKAEIKAKVARLTKEHRHIYSRSENRETDEV